MALPATPTTPISKSRKRSGSLDNILGKQLLSQIAEVEQISPEIYHTPVRVARQNTATGTPALAPSTTGSIPVVSSYTISDSNGTAGLTSEGGGTSVINDNKASSNGALPVPVSTTNAASIPEAAMTPRSSMARPSSARPASRIRIHPEVAPADVGNTRAEAWNVGGKRMGIHGGSSLARNISVPQSILVKSAENDLSDNEEKENGKVEKRVDVEEEEENEEEEEEEEEDESEYSFEKGNNKKVQNSNRDEMNLEEDEAEDDSEVNDDNSVGSVGTGTGKVGNNLLLKKKQSQQQMYNKENGEEKKDKKKKKKRTKDLTASKGLPTEGEIRPSKDIRESNTEFSKMLDSSGSSNISLMDAIATRKSTKAIESGLSSTSILSQMGEKGTQSPLVVPSEGQNSPAKLAVTNQGERAYVPVDLARAHIVKLIDAMTAMKARHVAIVGELDATYKDIEARAQTQFVDFVNAMRNDYNSKLAAMSKAVKIFETEARQAHASSRQETENLKIQLAATQAENMALLQKCTAGLQQAETEKNTIIADLNASLQQTHASHIAEIQSLQEKLAAALAEAQKAKGEAAGAASAALLINSSSESHDGGVTTNEIVSSQASGDSMRSGKEVTSGGTRVVPAAVFAPSQTQKQRRQGEREAIADMMRMPGDRAAGAEAFEVTTREQLVDAQQKLDIAEGDMDEWFESFKESNGRAATPTDLEEDPQAQQLKLAYEAARLDLWTAQGRINGVCVAVGRELQFPDEDKGTRNSKFDGFPNTGSNTYSSAGFDGGDNDTEVEHGGNGEGDNGDATGGEYSKGQRANHQASVKWGEQLEMVVDALLQVSNLDQLKELLQEAQKRQTEAQAHVDELRQQVSTQDFVGGEEHDQSGSDDDEDHAAPSPQIAALDEAEFELQQAKKQCSTLMSIVNGTVGQHRARQFWPYNDADDSEVNEAIALFQDQINELQAQLLQMRIDSSAAVVKAVEEAKATSSPSDDVLQQISDLSQKLNASEAALATLQSQFEVERGQHKAALDELQNREMVLSQQHSAAMAERQGQVEQLDIRVAGLLKELEVQQETLLQVETSMGTDIK